MVSGQIQYGRADVTTSEQTVAPPVQEHFACAVRLGRRKSDPLGHLVLTGEYLQFRGGRDIEVVWPAVSSVQQANAAIVVSLHHTRRILHFCCMSAEDAARGCAIARELIALRSRHVTAFA